MGRVDESATGSVNFWSRTDASLNVNWPTSGIVSPMQLRAPSTDRGVGAFVWALVFFLVLYFGMVAIGISNATALLISLVSSFLIFLFVRTQGT